MDVSIIIASWNVQDHLRRCLNSILKQQWRHTFEVIVVDNASADQSARMIFNEFPQVKIIVNDKNLGFARAVNQGADVGTGDYVLLLNPDTEVLPGAIDVLLDAAKPLSDGGVFGGRLLNPDKTIQPSVRRFPTLGSQWLIVLKLHHVFKKLKALKKYFAADFDYSIAQKVDQVMGAYFLVPRTVWQSLGGLDEKFFIWFEEVDFCARVREAGLVVYYLPVGDIVHYGGESFKQVMSFKRQMMFNRSLRYFLKKRRMIAAYWVILLLQPLSVALALLSQLLARPSYKPKPRPLSKSGDYQTDKLFKIKQ